MAIGILGCNRNKSFKDEKKGGLVIKSPFIEYSLATQKLNVIPVVAALIVAPPIVSLAASREQTW
jgi:hypothetical protein